MAGQVIEIFLLGEDVGLRFLFLAAIAEKHDRPVDIRRKLRAARSVDGIRLAIAALLGTDWKGCERQKNGYGEKGASQRARSRNAKTKQTHVPKTTHPVTSRDSSTRGAKSQIVTQAEKPLLADADHASHERILFDIVTE